MMNQERVHKNLNVFFERYPNYKKAWEVRDFNPILELFQIEEFSGGIRLLEKGQLADSTDLSEFPKIQRETTPMRVAVVEGFGLGTNLQNLLQQRPPELERIIVVEPTIERFLYSLSLTDFEDLFRDSSIEWVIGLSRDEIFPQFVDLHLPVSQAIKMNCHRFIRHPHLEKRYKDYFDMVEDEYETSIQYIKRGWGFPEDSLRGFQHLIDNQSFIENNPGVRDLKGALEGIPAVICATGPSLSRSLPTLRGLQDRAAIFSADSALKVLLKNEITPHFVASLERDQLLPKLYEGLDFSEEEAAPQMIAFPFVAPETLKAYKGPKWVAYRDYGYFKFLEGKSPKGIISSSSSVSHMGLRLAHYFGCSPICFVGLDLSYDPESLQSHADGVAYEAWAEPRTKKELQDDLKKRRGDEIVWVYGNRQKEVPTDKNYFAFMKEFSWEATRLDTPILNCTDGGARLAHMEWNPLAEISESWVKTDLDIFNLCRQKQGAYTPTSVDWLVVRQFLSDLLSKMQQMRDVLNDIEQVKSENPEAVIQGLRVVRKAHEDLLSQEIFINFIIQNIGRPILKIENEWYSIFDDDYSDIDRRLSLIRDWSDQVTTTSQKLLEIIPSSEN